MLGVKTGKCVNTSKAQSDPGQKVCEIYAWCPVEIDITPMPNFNLRQASLIDYDMIYAVLFIKACPSLNFEVKLASISRDVRFEDIFHNCGRSS